MKRANYLVVFSIVFAIAGSTRSEELGTGLDSGPQIGEQIDEFPIRRVNQRRFVWSEYG